jgi:hypothetical protein
MPQLTAAVDEKFGGEELKRSIEMKRKFISSEIHSKYFKMIVNKIK